MEGKYLSGAEYFHIHEWIEGWEFKYTNTLYKHLAVGHTMK